jgi:hypothetical protein
MSDALGIDAKSDQIIAKRHGIEPRYNIGGRELYRIEVKLLQPAGTPVELLRAARPRIRGRNTGAAFGRW